MGSVFVGGFASLGLRVVGASLGRRFEGASLERLVEDDLCRPIPVLLVLVLVVGFGASLGRRVDVDLCNPMEDVVAAGLLAFARGGGGRIEEALLVVMLPAVLKGRVEDVDVDVERVGGLMGSLLGD